MRHNRWGVFTVFLALIVVISCDCKSRKCKSEDPPAPLMGPSCYGMPTHRQCQMDIPMMPWCPPMASSYPPSGYPPSYYVQSVTIGKNKDESKSCEEKPKKCEKKKVKIKVKCPDSESEEDCDYEEDDEEDETWERRKSRKGSCNRKKKRKQEQRRRENYEPPDIPRYEPNEHTRPHNYDHHERPRPFEASEQFKFDPVDLRGSGSFEPIRPPRPELGGNFGTGGFNEHIEPPNLSFNDPAIQFKAGLNGLDAQLKGGHNGLDVQLKGGHNGLDVHGHHNQPMYEPSRGNNCEPMPLCRCNNVDHFEQTRPYECDPYDNRPNYYEPREPCNCYEPEPCRCVEPCGPRYYDNEDRYYDPGRPCGHCENRCGSPGYECYDGDYCECDSGEDFYDPPKCKKSSKKKKSKKNQENCDCKSSKKRKCPC